MVVCALASTSAVGATAPGLLVPSVVRLTPPETTITIVWNASTFIEPSGTCTNEYRVYVDDVLRMTVLDPGGSTQHSATIAVAPGFHRVKVEAQDIVEEVIGPPACYPVGIPAAAETTFQVDGSAPTLQSVSVSGGAFYTRTRDVSVAIAGASDDFGLRSVELGPGIGTFASVFPYATTIAYQLPEGQDGNRTVAARVRDISQLTPFPPPNPLLDGNPSAAAADGIFLDRVPPTVNLEPVSAEAVVSEQGIFDASASIDGTNGVADSGLDATSWAFGDGTTGTGPTRVHAFNSVGTFNGSVTVRDRAGNQSSKPFTVTVKPIPPGGPERVPGRFTYRFRTTTRPARLTFAQLNLRSIPSGATVRVSCVKGCKLKLTRQATKSALSLTKWVRRARLAPGARLEVRVTMPGATIGWLARLQVVRQGRDLDVRATRCDLAFPTGKVTACRLL